MAVIIKEIKLRRSKGELQRGYILVDKNKNLCYE